MCAEDVNGDGGQVSMRSRVDARAGYARVWGVVGRVHGPACNPQLAHREGGRGGTGRGAQRAHGVPARQMCAR